MGLFDWIFGEKPRRLVLIEGDAIPVPPGIAVTRLYWHEKVKALLPGRAARPEQPVVGGGRLHGVPAWLGAGAADEKLLKNGRWLGLDIAPPGKLRRRRRRRASVAPKRIFYWVGLTVTQPFNTGVQRVVRLLAVALARRGVEIVPVKWDAAGQCFAPLSDADAEHLAQWHGPRVVPAPLPPKLEGEWLLLPEICLPLVPAGSTQARYAKTRGMRVAALFYDLIPLLMSAYYPPEVQTQFRPYWDMFAEVDVVLPISWTVAADIARYLAMRGLPRPVITPCPLAGEFPSQPRVLTPPAPHDGPVRLLAVGTWEPRKNYARLLRALAAAQSRARRQIVLTIVGRRMALPDFNAEIESLAHACGAYHAADVSDEALRAFYLQADATVFASWEEGFGLPVLESCWAGRPCLCHDGSAMAEVAPGGGAMMVDMLDEAAIAAALVRLADEPAFLQQLGAAAVSRPIRSWDEYAADVLLAMS